MFDIGAGELLVIGVVALIVIGPKELPGVLRQAGKFTNKMRQMAGEFRVQFDEAMREAELDEAKKHIDDMKEKLKTQAENLNPVSIARNQIHNIEASLNPPAKAQSITEPAKQAYEPKKVRQKKIIKAKLPDENMSETQPIKTRKTKQAKL